MDFQSRSKKNERNKKSARDAETKCRAYFISLLGERKNKKVVDNQFLRSGDLEMYSRKATKLALKIFDDKRK